MSYTIVKDKGVITVKALLTGSAETRELISALKRQIGSTDHERAADDVPAISDEPAGKLGGGAAANKRRPDSDSCGNA